MPYTYKIATININGIASLVRLRMLEEYLRQQDIDIVLLQEVIYTKSTSLRRYNAYVNVGTENRGTAILTKEGLSFTDITRLPSGRGIVVCYEGLRIIFFKFFFIIWIGVVFRALPPGHCSQCGFLYDSPFSKRSYFGRQVFLESTTRSRPLAARGGTMREKWWPKGAWDMHPGFFYMPQISYMGPFRRKVCWGFLSPFKNPTASAGFEPANLGIRGQHATSAPPKPLMSEYVVYMVTSGL